MTATGIIALVDTYGNISSRKKYKSKFNRELIIKSWIKNYNLKDKNTFSLQIIPDTKEDLLVNGYVCITAENHYERRFYRSANHREKIIKDFVSDNKLNKYQLEIMPNQ